MPETARLEAAHSELCPSASEASAGEQSFCPPKVIIFPLKTIILTPQCGLLLWKKADETMAHDAQGKNRMWAGGKSAARLPAAPCTAPTAPVSTHYR